jgi:hypothetical protein
MCTVFTLVGLTTFAASEDSEDLSMEDVSVVFRYTSDSVVTEGFTYKMYSDPITQQSGIELCPDFGIGYAIYDNPDTEIIDGLRINDKEVTSLRIPISSDTDVLTYEVAVRTVYLDSAAGSLAQILDGTYDYTELLSNPIIIFQVIYWGFLALTGIAGFIILVRNKDKRVKTSEDIAKVVAEKMDGLHPQLVEKVTNLVKAEILPLAVASVESGKEAVKAIVLSTSKSKNAPVALLELLKESSDIDLSDVIEHALESLNVSISEDEQKHSDNAAALHNIANNVIQEDVSIEKSTESVKNQKSIF